MANYGRFKDPDQEDRALVRRIGNARVREEARIRAEHGTTLPEDDRLLVGDTEARRTADRRKLEAAGVLAEIEAHAASSVPAAPDEWDEARWAAGSVTGK